jgi:hypothetical protein
VKMSFDHVVGNRPRAAVDHKNRIVGQCNPRVRRPNSLALGGWSAVVRCRWSALFVEEDGVI